MDSDIKEFEFLDQNENGRNVDTISECRLANNPNLELRAESFHSDKSRILGKLVLHHKPFSKMASDFGVLYLTFNNTKEEVVEMCALFNYY